jgi:hypothetical protein
MAIRRKVAQSGHPAGKKQKDEGKGRKDREGEKVAEEAPSV